MGSGDRVMKRYQFGGVVPSLSAIDTELARRGARQERVAGAFEPPALQTKSLGDPDDLPALTRLAERLEPRLRREFLQAVNALRGEIDLEALAAAVASGNVSAAEAVARLDELAARLDGMVPILRQGFLEGAGFAHQALASAGLALRFDLINPHAVTWVERHGADLVTGIADASRQAIRDLVAESVAGGPDVRATARAIRDVVGLTPRQAQAVQNFRERLIDDGIGFENVMRRGERYAQAQLRLRATTIARTEVLTSENAGQQALWREARQQGLLEATTRRVWIATPDDRLDEQCEALDGEETGLEEPFSGGVMQPPAHPQCLPGDTLVAPSGYIAAYSQRRYDGDLIVIRTASRKRLACTPNHPILTDRGWVAANALHVGAYVVGSALSDAVPSSGLNHQDVPARIQDVAKTLRRTQEMRPAPVPLSSEDFHGDRGQSKIAVVWTNRLLRDWVKSTTLKHHAQMGLGLRDMQALCLHGQGATALLCHRRMSSPGGLVSRSHLSAPLSECHARPLDPLGFALGSLRNVCVAQYSTDDRPRNAIANGQGKHGHSLTIAADDAPIGHLVARRSAEISSDLNAALPKPAENDVALDAQLARQLLAGESGPIALDQVVDVDRYAWSGHVFNLQTEHGFYVANGIITHNCRCAMGLVVK